MAVTAVVRAVTRTGSSNTCSGIATGPSGFPLDTATVKSTFGLSDFRAKLDFVSSNPPLIHFTITSMSAALRGEPSGGMKGSSFFVVVVHSRLPSGFPESATIPPAPPVIVPAKVVRSKSPFFLSGLWQEKHLFSSMGLT